MERERGARPAETPGPSLRVSGMPTDPCRSPACRVSRHRNSIYMTPDLRKPPPRPCRKEGGGTQRPARRGDGGLAQLVEHLLCKQGVNGSSPLSSTRMRSLTCWEREEKLERLVSAPCGPFSGRARVGGAGPRIEARNRVDREIERQRPRSRRRGRASSPVAGVCVARAV